MKITVLDQNTVTRGDIDLSVLAKLGELTLHNVIPENQLIDTIKDADAVICNKAKMTAEVMRQCPKLKYIGLFATGYDNVDTAEAAKRGIVVCNAPNYSTMSVAQHTFSLLLNLASNTAAYHASVQNGDWINSAAFTYLKYPIVEISGKTLGIIGYGAIGRAVAEIGRAFGMNVFIYTRTKPKDFPAAYRLVSFAEILTNSDFLTLHCPLTPQTKNLIDASALASMKKTAYLINTSRGGVIEEQALADALRSGQIAGAGIDVLASEPMKKDHPYFTAPNCILTPHVAWASAEARQRLLEIVYQNLEAFLKGNPIHNVAQRGESV